MSSNSSAYGGSSSSSSAAILTEQFSNGALRLVSVASPAVAWSAVGLPFDVIRHRLQVSSTSVTSIRGPIDCLQYTIRTEGVRALWSGLLPTLLMQVPYATIMFGTFETFRPSKKRIREQSQSNEQGNTRTYYSKVFLAGSAAGVPLTVLANPLDVWRTRVQTMGFTTSTSGSLANSSVVKVDAPPTAASSSSSSRQQTCTTRTSGASAASASSSSRSRSIFKALQLEKTSMTLIRNGPGNGFFFLFNEVLNDIQLPIQNVSLKKFVTGGLTGILFNILLHPVDVVKARLMVSDVKTISQVVAEVYKDMGFRGFFRGVSVVCLKAGPVNAAGFWLLHEVQRGLGLSLSSAGKTGVAAGSGDNGHKK
ncbi:unnamed protein product [Amoebophrya sp. A25]|nr:unnamed protein product [Amoebophrya sp. A25]|eukprot:GSA25T00009692001.1